MMVCNPFNSRFQGQADPRFRLSGMCPVRTPPYPPAKGCTERNALLNKTTVMNNIRIRPFYLSVNKNLAFGPKKDCFSPKIHRKSRPLNRSKSALQRSGVSIRLLAAIIVLAGMCTFTQAQSELPFRLVNGNLIVVALVAGDNGPFNFILDTGADTTIVDSSLAARLSLVPLKPVRQTTLSGVQTLSRSLLVSLSAGSSQVNNLPVIVQDLGALRRIDSHIQGIVGQDFLSHFNYLLDYRRRTIRIEAANEIRNALEGDRVSIESRGNRMIVPSLGVSLRRAPLRLLLDSGASSLVLIRKGSKALEVPFFQNVQKITSSGNVSLGVGRVRKLMVGSEQFDNVAVSLSAAEPVETIGDGLLPTALFDALYVNNREGFVVFNPRHRKN